MKNWPYPTVVAHRCGGKLAPENTLAAVDACAHYGHKMVEFDVKLSKDNHAFLLHDDTLERTTNGQGIASDLIWKELAKLEAGSWYSPRFNREPLPNLTNASIRCLLHGIMANIELKPTTGNERATGRLVALAAQQLWSDANTLPLLSSFSVMALSAAQQAAPELPRGLLIHQWRDDWLQLTASLDCLSIHVNHTILTESRVTTLKEAGLRILAYTVNDPLHARTLLSWGVDSLCTDRLDLISPNFQ